MTGAALIVDDEIYAVMGIKSGIDWEALRISEVYEAYNMREAIAVFERSSIDILICDIDMPKGTGIELVEWVNTQSPATETIFLTAHSDFAFMQRAVQLGSFDYMLKPVAFDTLQTTLEKAMQALEQERELERLREQYKPYYELWTKNKPLVATQFWNDLFARKKLCAPDNAASLIADHELPITPQTRILPIVISVESWLQELGNNDEEMLEYALREAASDILLEGARGAVLETKHGVNVVILFAKEGELEAERQIESKCRQFIDYCKERMGGSLSCYIGEASLPHELRDMYRRLLDMEYNNLHKSNQVYWYKNYEAGHAAPKLPEFAAWTILLEQGKKAEMEKEINRFFSEVGKHQRLGADSLHAFYNGFLQMIHYILHKKGLSAHELLDSHRDMANKSFPRSLEQLQVWALKLVAVVSDYLHHNDSVIKRLQCYIADRLNEAITREQLAEHVHLNPAYLSRLFKKEVGESITDYILRERMKVARELIQNSTIPISDIARSLGFSNFSYFSKMFKKVYGTTPQHCRR
ncbi:helix-turn-helix domain-containing protein [Paenibacillus alkaliterrae]|uniref:helix-turn-helix domain-containing protein n=1 Tax=Paenibacillus alkaliterrae TaxID=320909 RepID=UPI001F36D1F9|nr:helix-turn-helix domain-containing protein [Paenibacillus alkaliterrae]MCF2938669.1 helix-turn-helix domain-containing protein [Paenibacillus alkaliterrae]